MKKAQKIIICLLTVPVCITGCSTNAQKDIKQPDSPLVYLSEQSMMTHDFENKNGKVYIYCDISIKNSSDKAVSFTMQGDFTEDQQGKLLQENKLSAVAEDSDNKVFSIRGHSMKTYPVVFIGDHGEKDMKQNRLPPKTIEFEIQDSSGEPS